MSETAVIRQCTDGYIAGKSEGRILSFTAAEDGVRFSVGVDGNNARLIIREARHDGAGDALTARVLDKLCTLVIDRPLQEAADHGAIYVTAALAEDCAPVTGIRTPRNAGPAFALAERLARQVHAAARAHLNVGNRENAWYIRPNADWLMMDEISQANAIKPFISRFLRDKGLGEEDIFVSRIERGTRVTVVFGKNVTYKIKPRLMMELEQQLRRKTGNPLELFMEEMKDANRIRRL